MISQLVTGDPDEAEELVQVLTAAGYSAEAVAGIATAAGGAADEHVVQTDAPLELLVELAAETGARLEAADPMSGTRAPVTDLP